MRVVDRLLLVGGQNGGGSVFENGAADAVYLLGSLGPETALPLSTSPSKAGGRWLAHDWRPYQRREVFENGAVDAVHPLGITGLLKPRFRC